MNPFNINPRTLALVVGTRAALAFGIGLLVPHAYSVIRVRLITRPAWRARYSSTVYSLGVRSMSWPDRVTSRVA